MTMGTDDSTENIRMLIESAGAVVPVDGALTRVRAARHQGPGFEQEIWTTIAEMGWLALLSDEDAGGLGLGMREATALCSELGRGLVPEPVISALFAIRLMEHAGALPEDALTGETVMLAAWQASPIKLNATKGVVVQDSALFGTKVAVDGAMGADQFVVTTDHGVALVPTEAAGLTIKPQQMHDGTVCAEIDFHDVHADILPCPGIQDALDEAVLMHAGYLLGVSERAFEITLDYLRVRQQFDVAIGSFQALQHRATEIKVQLELARAAIAAAAAALDLEKEKVTTRMAILRARHRAGSLARLVAREAIQMHGAIGYTDEADIGLFARKAMVAAGQFGAESELRSIYMALHDAAPQNAKVTA